MCDNSFMVYCAVDGCRNSFELEYALWAPDGWAFLSVDVGIKNSKYIKPYCPEHAHQKIDMIALKALDELTGEERLEAFDFYCSSCGCKQPWHPDAPSREGVGVHKEFAMRGCQCGNDE
jgi:hypothetical protein